MGAIASKKASWSGPVAARIASASAGEVRGPVANIQLPVAGRSVISPCCTVTLGWACRRAVTSFGKGLAVDGERTARGHAVSVGGLHDQPPAARISQCSRPTALAFVVVRAEGLLEHTISARSPV